MYYKKGNIVIMNSCSWKGNLQPEVSALDQEITEGDSDMMEMLKLLVFGICPACRSLSYSWDEFQNTAWSHLCLSAVTFPINLVQQQQKYPPKNSKPWNLHLWSSILSHSLCKPSGLEKKNEREFLLISEPGQLEQ